MATVDESTWTPDQLCCALQALCLFLAAVLARPQIWWHILQFWVIRLGTVLHLQAHRWRNDELQSVVQERERGSMEELEEAKQQAQTATHAFNAVRQARFDTFMKAFSHISAGIDRIFKVATGLLASLSQVMLCMAPLYMLVALQI